MHPKVVQLHGDLLAVRPAESALSPALRKVVEEAAAVGKRHDPLARAVAADIEADRQHCLGAAPPDLDRARQCEEVSAKLFPNGLKIVSASLLAEAGNTARVEKLLQDEPAISAFLQAIPVRGKRTLLDTTQRWIAAGAELGRLEHAREELEAKVVAKPVGRAAMNTLRGRWIRLVSLILSTLEVSEAPAEAIETIRGPVLKASERAARRYAGDADEGEVEAAAEEAALEEV